jgi:hypothetical protein
LYFYNIYDIIIKMSVYQTNFEHGSSSNSQAAMALCRDALVVAYGTQYYATELMDLSNSLVERFPEPLLVECEEYVVVNESDCEIDFSHQRVRTESVRHYTTQPYPEGVIVGLITPELIALSESELSDRSARTPYLMLSNPDAGMIYFIQVADITRVVAR